MKILYIHKIHEPKVFTINNVVAFQMLNHYVFIRCANGKCYYIPLVEINYIMEG